MRHGADPGNLVFMVPFAAIEAWTYRNLPVASELAQREDAARCAETHARWAEDPALLEARTALRKESPLENRFNLELVQRRWPGRDAYADGRSFRGFADALAACPALRG